MGRCSGQGPPGSAWVMVLILPLSVGASGGLPGPTAPGKMEPARGPPRAHSLAGGPPNSVGPLEDAASPAVCCFRAGQPQNVHMCTPALGPAPYPQHPQNTAMITGHSDLVCQALSTGHPSGQSARVTTASEMRSQARSPNDAKSE